MRRTDKMSPPATERAPSGEYVLVTGAEARSEGLTSSLQVITTPKVSKQYCHDGISVSVYCNPCSSSPSSAEKSRKKHRRKKSAAQGEMEARIDAAEYC